MFLANAFVGAELQFGPRFRSPLASKYPGCRALATETDDQQLSTAQF